MKRKITQILLTVTLFAFAGHAGAADVLPCPNEKSDSIIFKKQSNAISSSRFGDSKADAISNAKKDCFKRLTGQQAVSPLDTEGKYNFTCENSTEGDCEEKPTGCRRFLKYDEMVLTNKAFRFSCSTKFDEVNDEWSATCDCGVTTDFQHPFTWGCEKISEKKCDVPTQQ